MTLTKSETLELIAVAAFAEREHDSGRMDDELHAHHMSQLAGRDTDPTSERMGRTAWEALGKAWSDA